MILKYKYGSNHGFILDFFSNTLMVNSLGEIVLIYEVVIGPMSCL